MFDGLPADAKITVASEPVRIDPAPVIAASEISAHGNQIESSHSENEAEAAKGIRIAKERRF